MQKSFRRFTCISSHFTAATVNRLALAMSKSHVFINNCANTISYAALAFKEHRPRRIPQAI